MFGFFAKAKAAQLEQHHDGSGSEAALAAKTPVKLMGHEYTPGNPHDIAVFNKTAANLMGTDQLIPVDGTDTFVPAGSEAGKLQLVKMQLKVQGFNDAQVDQAIAGLKTTKAAPPSWVFKAKASKAATIDSPEGGNSDVAAPADSPTGGETQTFTGKASLNNTGKAKAQTFRSGKGAVHK